MFKSHPVAIQEEERCSTESRIDSGYSEPRRLDIRL